MSEERSTPGLYEYASDSETMEMDELKPLNTYHVEDEDEIDNPGSRSDGNIETQPGSKPSLNHFWRTFSACALAALAIALAVIWFNTVHTENVEGKPALRSNGTSIFAPTTILISLDGFRADFLLRNLTPTLNSFVTEGISPRWMLPSFPSVTFSNHYTLATGLYPESHGIVSNTFWDPDLQERFTYADDSVSMVPKWWGGEPLWVTTERQGIRTAVHMWPGSEAGIGGIKPTYLDAFNGEELLSRKTDRVLGLLDLPDDHDQGSKELDRRPQFIVAYVPVIDVHGHRYGPNSTEVNTSLKAVDDMFSNILQGLQERNLTNIVNVVVVSDHGMASTSVERLIQLDDLIDPDTIEHIDGWPNYGLRPKDPSTLRALYDGLRKKAAQNPNIKVYLRDQNMPERYHFSKNPRIAPLWIMPKTGWAIVLRKDFDVAMAKATGKSYQLRGTHGYDHEHPLMRSIFIAKGPAFPHQGNSRLDIFQNIEVYNIICGSLGVSPRPNNGTLRLPLRPAGSHSDPNAPKLDLPDGEAG
ncbi:MAG: hypothetical protein Q9222_005879 [Ikaeria aurantiellina]